MLVLPTERNRQAYEEELERDEENALREFGCKAFDSAVSTFIPPEIIKAALTDTLPPVVLPRKGSGETAVAAIDTGFRRDPSGLVVVRIRERRLLVAECFEVRPQKGQPLRPSIVLSQFGARLRDHGVRELVADQHYIETVKEHLGEFGVIEHPAGNPGKAEVYTATRDALRESIVDIPDCYKRLSRQLQDIVVKPLAGGAMQITSPRRHGQHGDLASAFCAAIWLARQRVYAGRIKFDEIDQPLGGRWHDMPGMGF